MYKYLYKIVSCIACIAASVPGMLVTSIPHVLNITGDNTKYCSGIIVAFYVRNAMHAKFLPWLVRLRAIFK